MKIHLSQEEVLGIVKEHLASQGFQTSEVSVITKDSEEYEYYGIGRYEERSKVKCRYFDGIEAIIKSK
ncbi:hypothetical protein [Paenibacillus lautus]|uniref:hypothetical protein n=1 Tax=Paenibacillus lautus TaxID=1401 RepID=UPI001C7D0C3E|nr:hypothetical protein [Paenibacillus lautus]MBX4152284.1 hypothetical protein [Paenibacillus lautus]